MTYWDSLWYLALGIALFFAIGGFIWGITR